MPRTDREDSRNRLGKELLEWGISQQRVDDWIETFSDDHFTSGDIKNLKHLLFELRPEFAAQRKKLETDLESEKTSRQGFLDHIKQFVGESIDGLRKFEDLAETANKGGVGHSPTTDWSW